MKVYKLMGPTNARDRHGELIMAGGCVEIDKAAIAKRLQARGFTTWKPPVSDKLVAEEIPDEKPEPAKPGPKPKG